jgi:hypothetical protein
VIVDGGSVAGEPLLASAFADYAEYVDLFFSIVDRRYGNWSQLPFHGGYLDQPARTMVILGIMRSIFIEKLSEKPSI